LEPSKFLRAYFYGLQQTDNFMFAIDQEYTPETVTQTSITETASIAGPPAAVSIVRSQVVNTCQIEQEQVDLSYKKLSSMGKLSSSGVLTVGQPIVPVNEEDWQIARKLEFLATKLEYTILRGTYVADSAVGTASKTRGLNEAATTTAAEGGLQLSKPMIQKLLRDMWTAGARFINPVFVVGVYQKQKISELYGYAPTDRNIGGINIKQIETDVGNIGVMLNPFQLTSTLLLADLSFVKVVTCPVPSKGNFFLEPLGKTGASDKAQIYGQWGLNHGPCFMHGTLTGLAVS
jgi:hypothetical protein